MKLDAEDYENIYLRIRGKLWTMITLCFAALGLTGIVSGYVFVQKAAKKSIDTYVSTESFKDELLHAALKRMAGLEKRVASLDMKISDQEKLLGSLANLPISAGPNGLTVVDAAGKKFYIETGSAAAGKRVDFSNPFTKPPFVTLVFRGFMRGDVLEEEFPMTRRSAEPMVPSKLTERGFALKEKRNPMLSNEVYSWIAVGN